MNNNAKSELSDPSTIESEKNIRLKEKLNTLIVDAGTEPIFVHDLRGNFIYVNGTACNYLDYSRDEFMEINLNDIYSSHFFIEIPVEALISKNNLIFQSIYLKKDKSITPVEIRAKIIDLYGEKLILSIIRDIKKREEIEKIIEDKREDLHILTDNMMDFIYYVNGEGTFEYISPSVKELLGYDVEDILGKKDIELINIAHPDDIGTIINGLQTAIETLKPKRIQHRYKHKNGDYIWVETIGNPLSNEKGEFSGAVYITRDIQELKKMENQLKSSLEEKEVLLKEIHHRVKNNMQIISSLLNLQSNCLNDENAANSLKESRDRVKSMAIVHEKLYKSDDLSKIDFAEYVKKFVNELLSSYEINPGKIKPMINMEPILVDINHAIPLGLIINELVSNCIKHAFPANYPRKFENKTREKRYFSGLQNSQFCDSINETSQYTIHPPKSKISRVSINHKNEAFVGSSIPADNVRESTNGTFNSQGCACIINIRFYMEDDKKFLIVSDNGIGFPQDIEFKNSNTLGLQLVNALVNQICGTIKLYRFNGTTFKIIF